MADYISREAAIALTDQHCFETSYDAVWMEEELRKLPAADVRPVVKAHWIYHEHDYGDYYECSHCHDEYVVYEGDMCWKHCPTCGAYMEKMITGKEENGRT